MEIGNGATLEMIENLLDGTTPAAEALYAETAGSATKAAQDAGGNDIASTYATKAELAGAGSFNASGTYPNLTAGEATHADSADSASTASYATSAGSAATATYATSAGSATNAANATSAASATNATNATNDGEGNNIAATYATKAELATAGGSGGNFDASGTYPNLTAGSAQNVSDLYVHYIHGVDTRGGSGQCVYWNAVLVTESSSAVTSLTGAYLRGLGYAEGDSFPMNGYLSRSSGTSAVIVGLRLLASDYLALELVDAEGAFSQFPVASALSVNSSGQNGSDNVRRVQ